MTCHGGCCDRHFHDFSPSITISSQFPDIKRFNTERASSWLCPLLALCLLHLLYNCSSFNLHWLPLSLHYSTFKGFDTPSLAPSSLHDFLPSYLGPIHLSLAMYLNRFPSPFPLHFHITLLYPSVQTSVSKRLGMMCCAKWSAQIWITAVWRYVWDNSQSVSLLA